MNYRVDVIVVIAPKKIRFSYRYPKSVTLVMAGLSMVAAEKFLFYLCRF